MTDAREIIANGLINHGMAFPSPDVLAVHLLNHLSAAGFRVLGPDEVDPVTLEKAAEMAERMLRFADTTSEADIAISEAIRALGRKAKL